MENQTADKKEGRKQHFVFCLDSSGSMQGAPWADLMVAYNKFLDNRIVEQHGDDYISVIRYENTSSVVFSGSVIDAKSHPIPFSAGGTNFGPPLRDAFDEFGREECSMYSPTMVFMSDGHGSTDDETLGRIARANKSRGIAFHFVSFGGSGGYLQPLADFGAAELGADRSKHYNASNGAELAAVFLNIA
uniref:VWFA domain-containing protein n=1 Tax=Palpitomonas bilix TaxID=652834 RepID=A0A7S3DCW7_9EUKA|mmetsp:Transcript_32207/g.83687  ORF Transcript_32207/g.83687 Transcript_32207/m.83687 type:complete len:189 (+) Transcript_32207:175-741(+)|eukprot:CAMPEP_0113905290 /NCGR_PEP_ID=MMETSP0780_2-20120614/23899_1 /TAXON_ID=652834 /ORGANISM="Palpitomonas bilix" /LENGTH=188 /DNA_ID=CAMNT_0000899341 /DNA_START=66 /DNA_END=632 /DNA_ORIENTATION=+ /assembly_acc=CAM_ASM_000599